MSGETNLAKIIALMKPVLNEGEFVFTTVDTTAHILRDDVICEFKEAEAITLVLERSKADELNLSYNYIASWITLKVHSSLDAVGLTAVFSTELAKHNLSCNVIAGFYHDHIFIDKNNAIKAIQILKNYRRIIKVPSLITLIFNRPMSLEPPFRKIIHVDMDAFYASVAQLDDPSLRGKAIAVGGGGERGVISAASYEARKFGVRSAMSGVLARKKCPHLIFVKTNFKRYTEISKEIRNVFYEYTDLVEPLSLDEAYLDVTENKKGHPSATLLAIEIRERIFEKVGLRASAGISINKFVAKVASDINKPNGQKTIPPEEVIAFLEELDIAKFYGVGKVTAAKMYNLGIFKGKDLKEKSLEFLVEHFKKSGAHYYDIVRGVHHGKVKPNRIRKSIAAERTFIDNLTSEVYMLQKLDSIAEELERRLKNSKVSGKTVTLKIKYSDFTMQTRSKTLPYFITDKALLLETVKKLLYQERMQNSVRLLGISVTNLNINTKEKEKIIDVQLKLEF